MYKFFGGCGKVQKLVLVQFRNELKLYVILFPNNIKTTNYIIMSYFKFSILKLHDHTVTIK